MDGIELVSFQIISNVGAARSCFIEAIQLAKAGKFDEAQTSMDEGAEHFTEGHKAHMGLIQQEAGGEPVQMGLLLAHAEDQLMSAEAFQIIAEEFIAVYKRLAE